MKAFRKQHYARLIKNLSFFFVYLQQLNYDLASGGKRDDRKFCPTGVDSHSEQWFGWETSCEAPKKTKSPIKWNTRREREEPSGSDKERSASERTMPSPSADAMDTSSQYSSCETLDSHRSSEYDDMNGNEGQRSSRKVSQIGAIAMLWMSN